MKKRMVIGSFVGLLMVGAVANAGDSDALVALDKKWGAPSVIEDGVTIAKEIELPDPFENM